MSIRVLVADDQDIVRTGLTMILEAQPDIEVVGQAANGREAVELTAETPARHALLDIRMPELDGLEATRGFAGPDVDDPLPVVVITTFDLDDYVYGAEGRRARLPAREDAGPALLTQAIQAAAAGDALIAPNITARLLAAFADTDDGGPPPQPRESLTSREEELLILVARGRTDTKRSQTSSTSASAPSKPT